MQKLVLLVTIIFFTSCEYTINNEMEDMNVYIDGTTAKTRTLDKYLTTKSLPSKPRWRAVIQTANYVIDHCELSQEDHNELLDLINALDLAYS